MKLKTIDLALYKPHPKNPNTHPDSQLEELQNSLAQFEQVKNIVVWRGFFIAGHGLVEAAKRKGLTQLQAIDVSHWPAKKAESFMIADNRLSEMAVIDEPLLRDLLGDFADPLEIPGITDELLAEVLKDGHQAPSALGAALDQSAQLREQFQVLVICRSEAEQAELLDRLGKEGYQCRSLIS